MIYQDAMMATFSRKTREVELFRGALGGRPLVEAVKVHFCPADGHISGEGRSKDRGLFQIPVKICRSRSGKGIGCPVPSYKYRVSPVGKQPTLAENRFTISAGVRGGRRTSLIPVGDKLGRSPAVVRIQTG